VATTFDDNERSASQNRPVDLYTIVTPTQTYRLTSNPVDVPFGGNTFTALTIDRGTNQLTNDQGVDEQTITLPISHPLVQRYAASGIPEQVITVTIQRLQTLSGAAQQIFTGSAQSLRVDGHTATIRCPASTADALKIQLPVIGATRICNHRLFDFGCAPNPGGVWPVGGAAGSGGPLASSFQVPDAVVAVSADGLTVTCSAISAKPNGWAALGRIFLASGEQRRILSQVGAVLTIAVPFVGLAVSTAVTIEAGCLHDISVCKSKFNNQFNFGGHPLMTTFNAWANSGFGVIQQV